MTTATEKTTREHADAAVASSPASPVSLTSAGGAFLSSPSIAAPERVVNQQTPRPEDYTLLTPEQVAKHIRKYTTKGGKQKHYSGNTIRRWIDRGIRVGDQRVRLRCATRPIILTCVAWVDQFWADCDAARQAHAAERDTAPRAQPPTININHRKKRTPKQHAAAQARATQQMQETGLL